MHRAVSRPWARGLLGCAVCFVLLQDVFGFTAAGNVEPSKSYLPLASFGEAKPKGDSTKRDVVIFMQNITFPTDPTGGILFDLGGSKGAWAGIRTFNDKKWFQVQAGSKGNPVPYEPTGYIVQPAGTAAVITENFPTDGGQHDVLILITVGTSSPGEEGSVRVFIDCEEVGMGFTTAGSIGRWADSNNGAYLLAPVGHGPNFSPDEGKMAWPGGTVGAGPMHIYYDAATNFPSFTASYFGCTGACSASQRQQCDLVRASANCSADTVSCECNFPFLDGDGSPGSCVSPPFTAITDTAAISPHPQNARAPAGSIGTRGFRFGHIGIAAGNRDTDVIFYMQGITFPLVPSKGTLFSMGGRVGVWVGIQNNLKFEAYVKNGAKASMSQSVFPQDGKKHTVLVYVSIGDDQSPAAIRVFIDCEEIGSGTSNRISSWADGHSGTYLLSRYNDPGPWPGGDEGAGLLNIYTAEENPLLFAPFTPYYFGCGEFCNGPETASCDRNADCARGNFSDVSELVGPDIWPELTCTCRNGFEGPGETCTDINECLIEAVTDQCHYISECDNTNGSYACVCPVGFVGEGADECFGNAWAVRTVFNVPELALDRRALTADRLDEIKLAYAQIISADPTLPMNSSLVSGMPVSFGAYRYGDSILEVLEENADGKLTLMALMLNQTEAEATVARLTDPSFVEAVWLAIGTMDDEPHVYRWVAQTTSAALEINPSGLQVDSVYFDPVCMSSGCWRVQITYTVGRDNLNVIFLPKAVGDDSLSYDFDYGDNDATWLVSPEDTFEPSEHPCGTLDYNPTAGSALPASVTACCIPQFLEMYRPVSTFEDALGAVDGLMANLSSACDPSGATAPVRNRAVPRAQVPIIARRGQDIDIAKNVFPRPTAPLADVPGLAADVFSDGVFSGMNESRINHTEVVDAYIGIYRAVLSLDEVELRRLGGQLRGTVGVEHTVDTFIGKLEFSMTGSALPLRAAVPAASS